MKANTKLIESARGTRLAAAIRSLRSCNLIWGAAGRGRRDRYGGGRGTAARGEGAGGGPPGACCYGNRSYPAPSDFTECHTKLNKGYRFQVPELQ
ncbi:unnamed protein product [Pieris brassicae]|uniref:Uncharacterized protein n=1 Tax=Pieris brassicae TaxID=7116 RepID=A0A9P0TEU7_PIEBR|nr:unnamed protein product [Pieris brassicae]